MNTPNNESVQLSASPEEESFGYGQLLGIVLKRWPWMLGAVGCSLVGAFAIAMNEEPIYLSSMQLIVEPNFESRIDIDNLEAPIGGKINDVDYATQLNVMRSERFLVEAIQMIEKEYPKVTIKQVKKSFELSQVTENDTETRIFAASYQANNSKLTKDFLEALKTVYLEYNQTQQEERLNRGLDYINRQLDSTRISLKSAQSALERFREQAKIVDPSTQAQKAIESLTAITATKQQLQADIADSKSKYQFLLQQIKLSPEKALIASRLSQSEQIKALLQQLQNTELEIADRRTLFTEADPTLKLLVKKQKAQQELLQTAIKTISQEKSPEINSTSPRNIQLGNTDLSLISELLLTNTTLQGLNARLIQVNKFENELKEQIGTYPKLIAEYDRLQPEVDTERETLQRLLKEREQLTSELAKGGYTWQIVEEPDLGKDISVTLQKRLSLGFIFGLFSGCILIFVQESSDTVLRNLKSVRKKVPFPLLGSLPIIKKEKKQKKNIWFNYRNNTPSITSLEDSHLQDESDVTTWGLFQPILSQEFQESIDIISNILLLHRNDNHCETIAITSSLPGEGRTTVVWGLAYSLSRMNQNILIIDSNLRNSTFNHQPENNKPKELATYLNHGGDLPILKNIYLRETPISFVPAGSGVSDPLTLLSSPHFEQLLSECRKLYDVILIDTSPLLGIADTLKVASICDSIVLVTKLGQTTQADLEASVSILRSFNVLGVITNGEQIK